MEVKINREIREYTESMFFGLSMRQCVFSVLAIAVAVGLYFLLRPYVGVETVSWVCILGAAPFAALGFVSYHGMPAERFIIVWLRSEIIEPRYLTASAVNSIYYEATKDVIAAHEKEGYRRHEQNRQKHDKARSRKVHRSAQSTGRHTMVTELTDINRNMMLSLDILPVPTEEAVREVENRLLGVETNITNWQRRQNNNNNFSAVIPYDMELQRKEAKEFLDDLTTRDQRMMHGILTMVLTAGSKEQLDSDTEAIRSIAGKNMCQLATLTFQQIDGLNTVLPIGTRKIDAFRTLTTESLAVFMPFKVQEIHEPGGLYLGQNAISHNLILCDRENLMNQSGFVLGVPGGGKSFFIKEMILQLILNTEDEILICDPENEYEPLIKGIAADISSVIHVAAGGKDRLNAMYMVKGYGEKNPLVEKSQFIMSLVEQIDKNGVGPQHRSIIDRCTAATYMDAVKTRRVPTLCTLREKLLEQPEPEAKEIALALELYTTGSLDVFGHESTVDLNKRILVFDIHDLG